MQKNYFSGVVFCLLATISWGAMFPVMTHALIRIDPFTFTAMRFIIAGIVFLILLIAKEGLTALDMRGERVFLAWALGSAGFAGFGFLVFLGQKLAGPTGALTASIMMATMPMLGLLVNWLLRGVRPALCSFCFILFSFFGVALVITKGDIITALSAPQNYSANVPLIIGALCWVFYTLGAGYFPNWSPYRYTAITTVLGVTTIFAVNFVLVFVGYIKVPSIATVISITPHLLYMALVAGFLGILSWNIGNMIITPLNGVLFMNVVPITAFIITAFSGVMPQTAQIVGASMTVTALVMNNLYQRRRMATSVPSANKAVTTCANDEGRRIPAAAHLRQ